jgi:hypothetical protein
VRASQPDISIIGLLADVGWRSVKAQMQRRDRRGRFAEMGGGFSFDFALPGGGSKKVTGKIVGISGTEDVEVEIRGYDGIQDGIYAVPSKSGEAVKAVIDINPSAVPDATPDATPQAAPEPEKPALHPQLTPTDDVAEAKATGRPLKQLQRGTFPEPVQAAYDELKGLFKQMSELPEGQEMTPGYTEAPRARLKKAVEEEFQKLGFTYEESVLIHQAISDDVDNYREIMQLKRMVEPSVFEKKYGDERRRQRAEEVLDNARIAVAIPYQIMEKIVGEGRLKSQFESRTSRGALNPTVRTQIDISQFGYHPTVDPTKRPIYGYLTSGGKMNDQMIMGIQQYGAIQLVMKKDVEQRSTYTGEDSLGSAQLQPKPFGEISPESSLYSFGYGEAQIHGGVSLQDVDYVAVQVTSSTDRSGYDADVTEEEFTQVSKAFEGLGIRVVRWTKGQQVDVATGEVIDASAEIREKINQESPV